MYCFINFNRKRKKEFVTINNLIELLAQLKNMRYNVREINKKRQAVESGNSLQPYAGAYTSHTADYCAFLIISTFLFIARGISGNVDIIRDRVCCTFAVHGNQTLRRFFIYLCSGAA